jgi:hypothetical protein
VSHFMFFDSATQLRSVDHFAKQAGSADVRKLLYLEAHGGRLERTVKTDQIVTGPFGAVIAEKTCFYNRPDPSWISVRIQSLNPEIGREIPGPVPEAPKIIPPLAFISIVRFFRTDPQLIFGRATTRLTAPPKAAPVVLPPTSCWREFKRPIRMLSFSPSMCGIGRGVRFGRITSGQIGILSH